MVTTIEIIGIAAGVGAIVGLAYYAHKKSEATKTVSTVTQSSTATAPATAQATGATASYPQTQTSTAPPYTATQAKYTTTQAPPYTTAQVAYTATQAAYTTQQSSTTQQSPWSQVQQYENILKQSPAWGLETVSQSYESWASSGAWYTKLHAPGVTPTTAITSASTAQSTGATATYPQTQTYGPPTWPYYPKPYQPSRYPGPGRWMPL